MSLAAAIRATPGIPCRPWPRHALSSERWVALGPEPGLALLAMWGDPHAVHALLRDPAGMLAVSVTVADGRYPALSPHRPAARLFERAIRDLWGHAAEGAPGQAIDERPWLDHGTWDITTPLSPRPPTRIGATPPVSFQDTDDTQDQLPIGPFAGNIAEAGQFRLFTHGPAIARLEARLGYLHKGIPALMRGKSPRVASRFAARLAGDAPVAHGIAFARAAEAACDTPPPPRAIALRAVMAELERLASHLADLDSLAQAAATPLAATPLAATPCQRHREAILRAANRCFGHRLMMDIVVPGGLAIDLAPDGEDILRITIAALASDLPAIAHLCEPLARRLDGIAIAPPAAVAALSPGGPAGRASGAGTDLRRSPGYRPYHDLNVSPVREHAGDAAARLLVLLAELRDSARMLRTQLADLPAGEIVTTLPPDSGEGFGWAEGPRGDIWTWLRLEGGHIANVFLRDPGWLILPLMETAMAGTDLSDWPAARASFGLSLAGMDL